MKNKLIYIFIAIIILSGMWIWYANKSKSPLASVPSSPIAQANYNCDDNKTINATFYKEESKQVQPGEMPIPPGSVKLILSDERSLNLPQTISADGGRYANSDESFIFWSKGDAAFVNEGTTTTFKNCASVSSNTTSDSQTSTKLANPASVNCIKLGGNLIINTRGDGGQYGLCYFEDNRACEEWALMRGNCPVGGVKTTGFDTIDQNYCAWSGGQTLAIYNSICTFKNGSKCSTIDFYNGKCSESQ
jgi:putative hemolysin